MAELWGKSEAKGAAKGGLVRLVFGLSMDLVIESLPVRRVPRSMGCISRIECGCQSSVRRDFL